MCCAHGSASSFGTVGRGWEGGSGVCCSASLGQTATCVRDPSRGIGMGRGGGDWLGGIGTGEVCGYSRDAAYLFIPGLDSASAAPWSPSPPVSGYGAGLGPLRERGREEQRPRCVQSTHLGL